MYTTYTIVNTNIMKKNGISTIYAYLRDSSNRHSTIYAYLRGSSNSHSNISAYLCDSSNSRSNISAYLCDVYVELQWVASEHSVST